VIRLCLREDTTMPRCTLGLILALTMLVALLAAEAQPADKVPRLGYLGDTPGPYAEAFRQGLRELGYMEGQNIAIEYRWALVLLC
jgi:putative ABC transport system substrate-binding protein